MAKKRKPFAETNDEILRVYAIAKQAMAEWVDRLGLDRWSVEAEYICLKSEGSINEIATIGANWAYQQAHVRVYLPTMFEWSVKDIEAVIVHELCHALVCEMRSSPRASVTLHEERVVTDLARVLMKLKYSKEKEWKPTKSPAVPALNNPVSDVSTSTIPESFPNPSTSTPSIPNESKTLSTGVAVPNPLDIPGKATKKQSNKKPSKN